MPSDNRSSKDNLILTPPPKFDSHQLGEAIIGARKDVKFIREDLLPPLIQDSREARDKAREALSKVDIHITNDEAHGHICKEESRQLRQDQLLNEVNNTSIELKSTVIGLDKWRWWLMGSIVGVAVIIGSFVISVSNASVGHQHEIQNLSKDVNSNEIHIRRIEEMQQVDREIYLKVVNDLPSRLQKAAQKQEPTIEDLEDAVDGFELTENEEKLLLNVIKRAKKRNGEINNNNGDR